MKLTHGQLKIVKEFCRSKTGTYQPLKVVAPRTLPSTMAAIVRLGYLEQEKGRTRYRPTLEGRNVARYG